MRRLPISAVPQRAALLIAAPACGGKSSMRPPGQRGEAAAGRRAGVRHGDVRRAHLDRQLLAADEAGDGSSVIAGHDGTEGKEKIPHRLVLRS